MASRSLNIKLNNVSLNHNFNPKMLSITLDRSLTYRAHLDQKAQKLSSRINLLQQFAGTSWGASAESLKTAALSLVFSTAEYCCPVWLLSSHCYKINVQLNRALRIVSGTIKPTPLLWLPVLSNTTPPDLRRKLLSTPCSTSFVWETSLYLSKRGHRCWL